MPVQQQVISCPAGQWTAICQQMDARQSLLVQCPQQLTNATNVNVALPGASQVSALGLDPLRTAFWISSPAAGFNVTVAEGNAAAANTGVKIQSAIAGETFLPVLLMDERNGYMVKYPYSAFNASAGATVINTFTTTVGIIAVVLGIATNTPTQADAFGTIPIGIWTSPSLAGGPAIFRLQRELDHDLTIQEWFAWPVGTGNINVQVYQSFDLSPPPDDRTISITGPKLTYGGMQALNELIAQYGDKGNPDVPPPDATF